ncbi:WXG100 family type VII secretion target [Kitasatospora sp. MAP5-34]|uniref:WXG100 family type VII secretion target n=1 Tax=Kitasatospora sp. MAP5-34 TaxID=3035102 RepID=UPI00247684C8|nr:WXG100 family type VII secretion target [Kitasatospora sp. MAP5-34]MDH6577142.1 uncharacterized protein YukE [Kitasatospora sp. MAP5-34]
MSDFTNFNGYSHGDLLKMVHSMDSGGVMSAGDPWRKASDTLKQIRTTLNTASGDATSSWEGASSEAFYSKMTKLAASVNNVAAYANDAAVTMKMMSEAIDQAKHDMPEEPSFLDKVGNAIDDTAKSAVGDDAAARTTITDEKKAKAVAVMELLATRYRAAASYLKPPPFGGGQFDDVTDIPPPADPTGAAAISALIMGGGMGLLSAGGSLDTVGTTSRQAGSSSDGQTPQAPKLASAGPSDPGIRGGMANPLPKLQSPVSIGPGTGIDGGIVGPRPGGGGGPGLGLNSAGGAGGSGSGSWTGRSGGGTEPVGGAIGEGVGGPVGRFGGGIGGSGRGAGAFGAGGVAGAEDGAGAAGGRGLGGRGGSLGRNAGGVIGEDGSEGAGAGTAGRRGFTEGGSGLGRGRAQAAQGAGGQEKGHGHGTIGGAQAKKKDKKQGRDRADYLVEDEETWASGNGPNSNVVE